MNEEQTGKFLELLGQIAEQNGIAIKQNADVLAYVQKRDEEIEDFLLRRDGRIIQKNGALEQAEKDLEFDIQKAARAEVLAAISGYKQSGADEILRDLSVGKWRRLFEDIADRVYAEKKAKPEEPQAAAAANG